jgi:hypothetical protein
MTLNDSIMSGFKLAEVPAFEQLTDLQLFIFADVSVDNSNPDKMLILEYRLELFKMNRLPGDSNVLY